MSSLFKKIISSQPSLGRHKRSQTRGENLPSEFAIKPKDSDKAPPSQESLLKKLTDENELLIKKLLHKKQKHKTYKSAQSDHIIELQNRAKDIQEQFLKQKERKKKYKKISEKLKSDNKAFEDKLIALEDELIDLDTKLVKAKNRKNGLKEHIKEVVQNEQKISQEIIQLRHINNDLSNKLKKQDEANKFLIDLDNIETPRSRKNTDTISQLKAQIQILEDQKEAALTSQTELTFSLQKIKTQYLESEEKYKKDIQTLENELKELQKNPSNVYSPVSRKLEFTRKTSIKTADNDSKKRVEMLFRNFRELKLRKEEAENAYKELELKNLYENKNQNLIISKKKADENILESIKFKLETTTKELFECQMLNLSQKKEIINLKNHIKVFGESEFLEPSSLVLQEQLKNCEKDLETVVEELRNERLNHSKETKELLDQLVNLKKIMQENEEIYENRIRNLVSEKSSFV
ncbi:hypothetical protein SteCoe_11252 [Stentor coeruleus]|uniref:Uncharacterized protein n=1 Tax=Stentor coeruleus TaxID=5963 RepID=A0A1R2CDM6_9CILI|nr:hypothetical protein SteCoe_11252 [Stentor coeruleus]